MFNIKKAAVFGIDARIALVLISIASLAIALNRQSIQESKRIKEISLRLLEVEDAIMEEYRTNYKNSAFVTKDYSTFTTAEKKNLFQGRSRLYTDPWGNDWGIKVFTSTDLTLTAFGEPVVPVCVVIFSAGADGHHYKMGAYTATNYDDCINNVGLNYDKTDTETNDDYFYKFTTIAYEVEINQDLEKRLNTIKQTLINYKESKKNIRVKYCNDLTQSVADADPLCDVDISGLYIESELDKVNFLPKSSLDVTSAIYASATSYDQTLVADLQALLIEIGLPTSYVYDLAGRRLYYNSNSTGATTSPYVASFYYKAI